MKRIFFLAAAVVAGLHSGSALAGVAQDAAMPGLAAMQDGGLEDVRAKGADDQIVFNTKLTVSDSAFANASGIFTVIQNTGNQVVLQNATVVNITINPSSH
jgi:hypothetical protein